MSENFIFSRSGRQWSSIIYTSLAVIGLIVLIFGLNAHPLIAAFFAVIVTPAVWDVIANNRAEMEITKSNIRWQVGKRANSAQLDEIDRVKARTGLDFSQRITISMHDGSRRSIPPACIPPGRVLDAELKARGVWVDRTIFL